jgi:hypothetical protein
MDATSIRLLSLQTYDANCKCFIPRNPEPSFRTQKRKLRNKRARTAASPVALTIRSSAILAGRRYSRPG